jgi:DNA helicase-2/ATP-dependent DNA helicase PcrA
MADLSNLTPEQRAVVDHPVDRHGRVLAGPGTGKSFTAMMLLARLAEEYPGLNAKMLTFSRAATASFAADLQREGLSEDVLEPSTLHSHALSVLRQMHPPELPNPVRIPDDWETEQLIRPHLASRITAAGYKVSATTVKDLEGEMAAGWERFEDDPHLMTSEFAPELKAAYEQQWQDHRTALGYMLIAEPPFRAAKALADVEIGKPLGVDLLIVDEYQDLNRADIELIRAHARLGVSVLAIGDDDQSIYGWRWAHPQGIREFADEFAGSLDYALTICHRFGARILDVATRLMSSARAPRSPLTPATGTADGVFAYLWFPSEADEVEAVLSIVESRLRQGVPAEKVLLLVRAKPEAWFAEFQPHFEGRGITLLNVEWVGEAVADTRLRALIAMARLLEDPNDSLAWLSLTKGLVTGVGEKFVNAVYDMRQPGEKWGDALLRLLPQGFPGMRRDAAASTSHIIQVVQARLAELPGELERWRADNEGASWSDWLELEASGAPWLDELGYGPLSALALQLLELVRNDADPAPDFSSSVGLLERTGETLALEEPGGVRLMTLAKSKGLTVDTSMLLGLESGMMPLERADLDEERRLLYVGLTRAREMCIATMVHRRRSQLAFIGGGRAGDKKERSSLVTGLRFGWTTDGNDFVDDLE